MSRIMQILIVLLITFSQSSARGSVRRIERKIRRPWYQIDSLPYMTFDDTVCSMNLEGEIDIFFYEISDHDTLINRENDEKYEIITLGDSLILRTTTIYGSRQPDLIMFTEREYNRLRKLYQLYPETIVGMWILQDQYRDTVSFYSDGTVLISDTIGSYTLNMNVLNLDGDATELTLSEDTLIMHTLYSDFLFLSIDEDNRQRLEGKWVVDTSMNNPTFIQVAGHQVGSLLFSADELILSIENEEIIFPYSIKDGEILINGIVEFEFQFIEDTLLLDNGNDKFFLIVEN